MVRLQACPPSVIGTEDGHLYWAGAAAYSVRCLAARLGSVVQGRCCVSGGWIGDEDCSLLKGTNLK